MSDTLYTVRGFATFNIIDGFNREVVAIEIDTSIRAVQIIRVLERIKVERELPHMIRVDNGPEFISPGRPTQNAFIKRFNRTYRNEGLNLYLFRSLEEVRELTAEWMTIYNRPRPHDALKGMDPYTYKPIPENSTLQLSAWRGSLQNPCSFGFPSLRHLLIFRLFKDILERSGWITREKAGNALE